MAGRVYDRRPLQVDRNPIKQLAVEVGNLPKTDPGKFVAAAIQFVSDYLIDAIKTVTGVDLLNPSTWPIIGDLIEAFTGIEDGDVNDLGTYANNIKTALGGLNLADPDFDFVRWAQNFLQVIIAPLVKLLNPLLGNEENPNLLAAGAFQTAASLSPESTGWSHDSAVGRTALGSAKFTAAGGVTGALQSNPIAVAPGQFLDVSGWVRWEGLTATGQAIKLDVNAYASTGGLVTTVTLDAITNPAANQLAWIELDTVWTVPAGVATIRIRPAVENASAGLVWFDDLVVRKTTLLQQQAQQLEDDAQAGAQAFATLLSSWQTTLTTPAQSWPTLFAALNDAWQTYVTTNNAIIADQWATLADIIYGVLGFNPTSGQLPPSKVEGLGDSWTQLGAALSGDLAHSGTDRKSVV